MSGSVSPCGLSTPRMRTHVAAPGSAHPRARHPLPQEFLSPCGKYAHANGASTPSPITSLPEPAPTHQSCSQPRACTQRRHRCMYRCTYRCMCRCHSRSAWAWTPRDWTPSRPVKLSQAESSRLESAIQSSPVKQPVRCHPESKRTLTPWRTASTLLTSPPLSSIVRFVSQVTIQIRISLPGPDLSSKSPDSNGPPWRALRASQPPLPGSTTTPGQSRV